MTQDFDVALKDRLARVAAAVPVEPATSVGRVRKAPVQAGWTARRTALGIVPVIAIVTVATLLGLARIGPFAPAASGPPVSPAGGATGPVSMTVIDGPFELTMRSAKGRYEVGESVDVVGSLTYRGADSSVMIGHGLGSPMAFGVIERIDGLFLVPSWRESCVTSVLGRDVPLERPFAKSGSFSGDNPAATDAAGFFEDPTLELPAGLWNLYVVADFGVGTCGVDRYLMRVDLAIVVGDAPGNVPSTPRPAATPAPEPTTAQPVAIDLATASTPAAPAAVCEIPLLAGTLELNDQTGLGLAMNDEHLPVRWPFGYTAWREAGDVVLRDGGGAFVARLGQSVSFGVVSYVGGTLVMCSKVGGIVPVPASS